MVSEGPGLSLCIVPKTQMTLFAKLLSYPQGLFFQLDLCSPTQEEKEKEIEVQGLSNFLQFTRKMSLFFLSFKSILGTWKLTVANSIGKMGHLGRSL